METEVLGIYRMRELRSSLAAVAVLLLVGCAGPAPPSQSWKTFLRNHAEGTASIDFFVVPTAACKLLFGPLIIRHERRQLVHVAVTANPTAG